MVGHCRLLRIQKNLGFGDIPGVSCSPEGIARSAGDYVGRYAVSPEQPFDIGLVAGEDDITVMSEQRDVCVDDIVGPRPGAEFAYDS